MEGTRTLDGRYRELKVIALSPVLSSVQSVTVGALELRALMDSLEEFNASNLDGSDDFFDDLEDDDLMQGLEAACADPQPQPDAAKVADTALHAKVGRDESQDLKIVS